LANPFFVIDTSFENYYFYLEGMKGDGSMERDERILVPLDGSECSEDVLPRVEELASRLKTGICLLRVVSARTFPGADPIEAEVKVVREAEEYLAGLKERLQAKGLDVDTHVRYGEDVEEIVDHASQKEIDLIAMSTHGWRGVNRLIHGSVAERVVQNTDKPVFVARCALS
jgi:nucleotide-binding universal stress UspA family protein